MNEVIDSIIEEMERVYLNDDRPWIIGFSGGKDSTVVVQLVYIMLLGLDEEKRKKQVHIVSSDTLVENPIILDRLVKTNKEIEKSAIKDNLPLNTNMVYPKFSDSFWTNIIGKGFPTPKSANFRWCTGRMKIEPSNRFIENTVNENGEAIVLLGVRKDESIARKQSIEKREIDGYLLNPHATLTNTYVYSPIVELTTDDVWEVLLSNGGKNPWGGSNNILFDLYEDGSGGECPFTISSNDDNEISTPSCGNTRFGCWTCTVVQKDRSLLGFIDSGEEWLIPLAEFRDWLMENRDNRDYRDKMQRTGRIYRLKVMYDRISEEQREIYRNEGCDVETDEKGKRFFWVKGLGPFNYKGRKLILEKLLKTEKELNMLIEREEDKIELIKMEELKEIENIWHKEFDIKRDALSNIYRQVKGQELPWADKLSPIFEDNTINEIDSMLEKYGIEKNLYYRLLILTEDNKVYSNKSNYKKSLDKLLNQQWLHEDIYDVGYKDEN